MVTIFARQAAQIRHPEVGLFDLALGYAVIPKLVTECSEFAYLAQHNLVTVGATPGSQESEIARARIAQSESALQRLRESTLPGPDLAQVRANVDAQGARTGTYDLVRKKSGDAIGRSYTNELEANAEAERVNQRAWSTWVDSRVAKAKKAG